MSSVGSSTQIVQPKEKTYHQLLTHWTYTFVGSFSYPLFGEKRVKLTHASQHQLHLIGHLMQVQVTSLQFSVLNPLVPEAVLHLINVRLQTWMRRRVQLSQEQYPMYGRLRILSFQLQQQTVQPGINHDCEVLGVTFYDIHKIIIHLISIVKTTK